MKITIHTPASIIPSLPEEHGTTLIVERVRSVFLRSFETKIEEERKLHNAFKK
jgi:hypothetical protein